MAQASADMEVPVVDLRLPAEEVIATIGRACATVGFFTLRGHGLEAHLVREAQEASRRFFEQEEEAKGRYAANGEAYGYFPRASEALSNDDADVANKPDLREAFSMGPQSGVPPHLRDAGALAPVVQFCYQPTPWPPQLQQPLTGLFEAMNVLAERLLSLCGQALGLAADHFESACRHHCNSLRAIHYYPVEGATAPGQLRCGAHSDTGSLTLLLPDSPGLEIQPRGVSEWIPVSCPAESLVVNIGDLLQRVSNDKWLSTPHRVVVPESQVARSRARYSLVLFQILAADAVMQSVGSDAKYPPVTQGEYLMGHFKRWGRNADKAAL
mmetsp:Transcript_3815/g.9008  ORF Transcript_3815/g.9008 Transcript_3815/m.9008 type:complete len:326 (+) Transcript_3815:16-993(+)